MSLLLTDIAFHFGCVFGFVGAYEFVFAGFNFLVVKCRFEMFVGLEVCKEIRDLLKMLVHKI